MSEWMPIESAPKDGDWILAWATPSRLHVAEPGAPVICTWDAVLKPNYWIDEKGEPIGEDLTHWMPLPEPPK